MTNLNIEINADKALVQCFQFGIFPLMNFTHPFTGDLTTVSLISSLHNIPLSILTEQFPNIRQVDGQPCYRCFSITKGSQNNGKWYING